MRADIAELQSRLGVTTVYVTHDQSEAMTLGHRVAVLDQGLLQQCATPRELYERPRNVFVAGFIGSPSMNFCAAPAGSNGVVSLGGVAIDLPGTATGRPVVLGFRPESVELGGDGVPAIVEVVEELGADAYVFCLAEISGEDRKLVARVAARDVPRRGERIALRPVADAVHVFDAANGERLSG